MIWPSVFQGTFFLFVGFHTVLSQNTLGSYGVPEEPLITPETDNQRQAEEQHEEHGGDGGHHHHSDNPLDWLRASVPGEPDVDYPIFATPPDTGFECGDKADGMYSDVDARCQVWHQCFADRKWSFLCPNGTIFNQEIFTCVWWFDFECDTAASFYSLNDNLYQTGGGSGTTSNGGNRGIGGADVSEPSTPVQPISQPRQPASKPRPIAPQSRPKPRPSPTKTQPKPRPVVPKSRPQPRPIAPRPQPQPKPTVRKPQPQPRPTAPKRPAPRPFSESSPVESIPAYVNPSVPRQPIAPAVQPIQPRPTSAQLPSIQIPSSGPIITDSYNNNDPLIDLDDRGTGINLDYDNSEEEGYNYKIPALENQLIIERPKKRKPATVLPSPTPRNDEGLDIEAPLSLYGAPPQPFDGGSNNFSDNILTPPVEEEEDTLPGYLPPDPRIGRKSRKGRRLGSHGRRGRGFGGFRRTV